MPIPPNLIAPRRYFVLLQAIESHLGAERLPILIGLDGQNGAGKTSLASWLAWQLGMPALHLDTYRQLKTKAEASFTWRKADFTAAPSLRLNGLYQRALMLTHQRPL